MSDFNPAPVLELAYSLLDETSHNPGTYYPAQCAECGEPCDPAYKLCYECQREADFREWRERVKAASNGTL